MFPRIPIVCKWGDKSTFSRPWFLLKGSSTDMSKPLGSTTFFPRWKGHRTIRSFDTINEIATNKQISVCDNHHGTRVADIFYKQSLLTQQSSSGRAAFSVSNEHVAELPVFQSRSQDHMQETRGMLVQVKADTRHSLLIIASSPGISSKFKLNLGLIWFFF